MRLRGRGAERNLIAVLLLATVVAGCSSTSSSSRAPSRVAACSTFVKAWDAGYTDLPGSAQAPYAGIRGDLTRAATQFDAAASELDVLGLPSSGAYVSLFAKALRKAAGPSLGLARQEVITSELANSARQTFPVVKAEVTKTCGLTLRHASTKPLQSVSTRTRQPAPEGPLAVVTRYWQSISAHQFRTAYGLLAPGSVGETSTEWIASEQEDELQGAEFHGRLAAVSQTRATVDSTSLITKDATYRCRTWSGSYRLVRVGGRWLIDQADLTPAPCAAPTAKPMTLRNCGADCAPANAGRAGTLPVKGKCPNGSTYLPSQDGGPALCVPQSSSTNPPPAPNLRDASDGIPWQCAQGAKLDVSGGYARCVVGPQTDSIEPYIPLQNIPGGCPAGTFQDELPFNTGNPNDQEVCGREDGNGTSPVSGG